MDGFWLSIKAGAGIEPQRLRDATTADQADFPLCRITTQQDSDLQWAGTSKFDMGGRNRISCHGVPPCIRVVDQRSKHITQLSESGNLSIHKRQISRWALDHGHPERDIANTNPCGSGTLPHFDFELQIDSELFRNF